LSVAVPEPVDKGSDRLANDEEEIVAVPGPVEEEGDGISMDEDKEPKSVELLEMVVAVWETGDDEQEVKVIDRLELNVVLGRTVELDVIFQLLPLDVGPALDVEFV
jgi:hypothetical protein